MAKTQEERQEMIELYAGFALTGIMTRPNDAFSYKSDKKLAEDAYNIAKELTDLIISKEDQNETGD